MTRPPVIARSDRDGVAVLALDYPGRSMNVVDERVLGELARHVRDVLRDPAVAAAVLTSGKPASFGAGADVSWLPELAAKPDAEEFLRDVQDLMLEMVRSPKPFVAAVDGPALGGALELALACHGLVATRDASLGLPEVRLELLPGGGGTQLILRWLAPADALDLLLGGSPLSGGAAHDRGLVTRVAPAGRLLDEAVVLAHELVAGRPRPPDDIGPVELDAAVLTDARAHAAERSRNASSAPERIVDVVEAGLRGGFAAGFRAEREAFLQLLRSPAACAAVHLFTVREATRRRGDAAGAQVSRLAVVGGGQMGAGIAATAVSRGISARVRDVSEDALLRARDYLDRVLTRAHPDPTPGQARLRYRWSATTGWTGLGAADAVIEAVFEAPDLKHEVLATVSERVGEATLVASNTSAIPIRHLATAVSGPERFLGMHFFSPVERMPLVELIPHTRTSPDTVDRAAALGRALGKVTVTVGDSPGFFTSRVYARWLVEGVRLLLDGVPIEEVDRAAVAVGYPVGPLQAHDEATLDLVVQASITQVAERVMADRLDVGAVRAALERLTEHGVRGRRHGQGFYRYDNGQRVGVNAAVHDLLGTSPASAAGVSAAEAGERLLLAFVTECLQCWDAGILCHPDDGDVASVLGLGFPRHLGGPFFFVDETGHEALLKRCEAAGEPAFAPGRTLRELAAGGGRLAELPRRPQPVTDGPA